MATSIAQKRHEVEVAPSIQAYDQLVSQDICDTVYTTRNTNFADVHNLDKCINHLNHSLATLGFSAANETRQRLPSEMAELQVKVESLTEQLTNKDRGLHAIKIKVLEHMKTVELKVT
uniref:Uncharacterized protein n=1 Tax=Physcomitrium patens TaxID=3218 RepID=A0A2K1J3B4_PHYPA|nr:hypothetical protein PHYPA_021862 [Physcomitrium patens]